MESKLQFLEQYISASITYREDGMQAVISSPASDMTIWVEYIPEDDFTPYVMGWATQHVHVCDEEDVLDEIREVMSGQRCALEFFSGGNRLFGGDIDTAELENLSYATLKAYAEDFCLGDLLRKADAFQLRGWNTEQNWNGIIEPDGTITVEKA